MQLTGKSKVLLGTSIVGTGVVGTSAIVASKNKENIYEDTVLLLVSEKLRNFLFLKKDDEDWVCNILVGNPQEYATDANDSINWGNFLDDYLENFEGIRRIKKEHNEGFINSCLRNSSSELENPKRYDIFLFLKKQKNGSWDIDKEDLNKLFTGDWINP